MRILVTGAAGFIGSNLVKRFQADGHEVVAIDDFSSGHWRNLVPFKGEIVTGDVADPQIVSILDRHGPFELISHQASITDTTVIDQRKMMHNNVDAFRNLLDLAVQWSSRVVWASSASTYGQNPAPNKESQRPQPLNVYAYSKLAMEHLANRYQPRLKHPIVGLRYFNVYGPGEDHKGKFASMIHQLAKQMRAGKRRGFSPPANSAATLYTLTMWCRVILKPWPRAFLAFSTSAAARVNPSTASSSSLTAC